ncbi:MAG: FAD-dependent monooxygenase [Bacteroidales bacterium]|nr:FAD-dependent monooxygenase [Bacteroidales bacterium]
MQNNIKNTKVLIVGAGPSGLMMACQLARLGVSFRIIEKKEHPTTYSGALIVQARTLEIFDQMGIAEKAIQEGIEAHKINIIFNGKNPLALNLKDIGKGLTKFPNLLMLEQSKTEQLLIDFIHDYGFSIERQTEFLRFSQDNDGVTSTVKLPDGREEVIQSDYLIAADGGQSLIRKRLNIPFLGKTHKLTLFVLDSEATVDMQPNEICFSFSEKASTGIFPLKDERWRIDGTIPNELEVKNTITFNDIEETYSQRTHLNIKLQEPQWFSVFHAHQRYAELYRQNRCFLVGDAAHAFSPIGAQGMNTGMQDVYNLAWKLSLVINGKAKESFLNTYNAERQPIAKKLVLSTDRAFQIVSSNKFLAKRIRLNLVPFLLRVLFPIVEKRGYLSRYLFSGISEIGVHYRKNALSNKSSIGIFPFRSPKPGDRLPYILFDGINLQDKVKEAKFHLIIFAEDSSAGIYKVLAEKYKDILSTEIIPLNAGTANLYKSLGIKKDGCYLVRPDMYIAYRSNKLRIDHFERFFNQYLQ